MINSICNEFFHPDGPTVNPQYQATKQDAIKKCQCDLRVKLVGDGCRYCNPQDYIDHLHDALAQKDTWVGLTDEERNHARQAVTYSQLAMTAGEWAEAVQIETERRLKEKNYG